MLAALLCLLCRQDPPPPNVVLVVAAAVDGTQPTPRLDAMAAEGMRWTQFYGGAPMPAVSRTALLSGRHSGRRAVRAGEATPTLLSALPVHATAATRDPEAAGRFVRDSRERPFLLILETEGSGDAVVGGLLDLVKELGLDARTLTVFTRSGRPGISEGSLRVPMIARWPGTIAAGSVSDEHAWAGDLLPTFCELAGAPVPADADGDSLAETLRGRPRKDRWRRKHELYWESDAGQALRFGKWKAIRAPLLSGTIQLYDMSNDPGEKRDYAARRPDLARHAAALFEKRREPDPDQ